MKKHFKEIAIAEIAIYLGVSLCVYAFPVGKTIFDIIESCINFGMSIIALYYGIKLLVVICKAILKRIS